MNNQIQTAIALRDRATQVALNFVGHSISSSDGSYEILIQVIHDALIAQSHVSAKAERDECVKILQKIYQEWFDGDHGPSEAFRLAVDNIRARANPTFKGAEIIFDED